MLKSSLTTKEYNKRTSIIWDRFLVILKLIKGKLPKLLLNYLHLNDGSVDGTGDFLNLTLQVSVREGPGGSLIIQTDKCELWSPSEFLESDKSIQRNKPQGLEVFGAAVGFLDYVASCLQKRVNKLPALLECLDYKDDPKFSLGFMHHYFVSFNMVYSLRDITPSNKILAVLRSFDNLHGEPLKNYWYNIVRICMTSSKLVYQPVGVWSMQNYE